MSTKRTAFFLYCVLLVLPTLVLGGLQFQLILREYRQELSDAPRRAQEERRKFARRYQERLEELILDEDQRPFDDYATRTLVKEGDSIVSVPSPTVSKPKPPGILAWFQAPIPASTQEIEDPSLFWGSDTTEDLRRSLEPGFLRVAKDQMLAENTSYSGLSPFVGTERDIDVTYTRIAALRAESNEDFDLIRERLDELDSLVVQAIVSPLEPHFRLEDSRSPYLIACRRVWATGSRSEDRFLESDRLYQLTQALAFVQGAFLDWEWFYFALPQEIADEIISEPYCFVPIGTDTSEFEDFEFEEFRPTLEFGIQTEMQRDAEFGRMHIGVDLKGIRDRFRSQIRRFSILGILLMISLGTGLGMLLRSVNKDLEQARRTENFVASVTHELRTPLSTIKLYGEMLLEGWAKGPEKQNEYYGRIVRETDRLSLMVERVLEKSRLAAGTAKARIGDLATEVKALERRLADAHGSNGRDLELELAADDLPQVWLTTEAVGSIVVNLVENARKYAPVDLTVRSPEPIVVRLREKGGRVLLEVLDRGPGVPESERRSIFDAFYRVGSEATRTTRGTGLGLHLVAMQAKACGGQASVHAREGGGACFRVSFRAVRKGEAPPGSPDVEA